MAVELIEFYYAGDFLLNMLRGIKGRSRGGGRGEEGSRGGRGGGWNRSRGHGISGGKAKEGSHDSESFCAGAVSEKMVSAPRHIRGGHGGGVGSKGRGAFVSTVGCRSFRYLGLGF